MDSRPSDPAAAPIITKIIIAGGFGVGKTTLVSTAARQPG